MVEENVLSLKRPSTAKAIVLFRIIADALLTKALFWL